MYYKAIVNNTEFESREVSDIIIHVLRVIAHRIHYASLDTAKQNLREACFMILEFIEFVGKNRMKQRITRMMKYADRITSTTDLEKMIYDSILSFDGKGLLPGFQFGSCVHKGDKPKGNAERVSILR